MANVSPEIVFGMLFLILSSADVDFFGRELRLRTYTNEKALPTTRCVELLGKKKFAAAELDPEHETYVVHVESVSSVASPSSSLLHIHCRPQIASLIAEEDPTKISVEYANFAFSPDLASKLSDHTRINDHSIELVETTSSSDHPSHPQVLPSFLTGSQTDPFGCVSIGATQTHRRE